MDLTTTSDASEVWSSLSRGFAGDTAVCNWVLSAISRNCDLTNDRGFRYWMIGSDGGLEAIGLHSADSGRLDVTPMTPPMASAMADAVFDHVPAIEGVLGPAGTAASFAGRWTELANVGARPTDGGRVLEVKQLVAPTEKPGGRVRSATTDDLDVLVRWNAGFATDTDVAPPSDPAAQLSQQIGAGFVWLWEDDQGPKAMAMRTPSVFSTRRLAHVYTPPAQRGRGLAAALVAHLASETLSAGDRCMLHSQLSNPSSNGVYRRLGFEAVSESTFYEFLD